MDKLELALVPLFTAVVVLLYHSAGGQRNRKRWGDRKRLANYRGLINNLCIPLINRCNRPRRRYARHLIPGF